MFAWVLFGALLGRGVAYFVPNLTGRRAMLGGALGGGVGAAGFVWATGQLGDVAGRLVGAASLGFFVGLMIALVEVMFRDAWLEIVYGPKEKGTVALGAQPVSVGSGQACTVWAADAPDVAFRYRMENNRIFVDDLEANRTHVVKPGDEREAGKIRIKVHAGATTTPAAEPR